MANQIGSFFAHKPQDQAAAAIAEHLRSFWEKRMLAEIYDYMEAGGAGLKPPVKRALQSLRKTTAA